MGSITDEAAWAGEEAPEADEAAAEGLPFRVFEVKGEGKGEAEDILRKARTGAGHAVVAMGHSKGSGAAKAGVRVCRWRDACVARVNLGDVVITSRGECAVVIAQVKGGAGAKLAGTAGSMVSLHETLGAVGDAHVI